MTADDVLAKLAPHKTELLILSGGEPLIHANHSTLRSILTRIPHEVHVETNGTLFSPRWLLERVALFSVSPKVAQEDDPATRRIRIRVLQQWVQVPQAVFKIVARDAGDVRAAADLAYQVGMPTNRLWIMPEGTQTHSMLDTARTIAPVAESIGAQMTLRMQTLLYGTERRR